MCYLQRMPKEWRMTTGDYKAITHWPRSLSEVCMVNAAIKETEECSIADWYEYKRGNGLPTIWYCLCTKTMVSGCKYNCNTRGEHNIIY